VVAARPAAVVIHLGATNDVGSIPPSETVANVATMLRAAKRAGIRPILLSPTPRRRTSPTDRTPERIHEIAVELEKLAKTEGVPYVDVASLLAAPDGSLREDLSKDALHPNRAGYAAMHDRVLAAVDAALERPAPHTTGAVGRLPK